MKLFTLLFAGLLLNSVSIFAQNTGIIRGSVKDKNTQETIIGASVAVENSTFGTVTDTSGYFRLTLPVGTYRLTISYLGYSTKTIDNIVLTSGNAQELILEMEAYAENLKGVDIIFDKNRSAVSTDMVTPLSVQQLTSEEVRSNPGGNFDVSRVIQTLPGVGGSGGGASRNDIIIRGGGPAENVYYLDGIEIPVLNHFQTQGSSGGATGILNVSFIDDIKLSSSAFDARYDNALASTFVIRQREGNPDKLSGNVRLSGTETALTLEGPLSRRTTFLASARRSYLQLLFKVLDLPIRPNYWDFQQKITHRFNDKTTLTAIGLGTIDEFSFATPKKSTPENIYITRSLPYINQRSYTAGIALKRLINKGYINIAISRNVFENSLDKFEDEQQNESTRTYKLRSSEIENKLRADINKYVNGWKLSSGIVVQRNSYKVNLTNVLSNTILDSSGNVTSPGFTLQVNNQLSFFKYGIFSSAAKTILSDRLLISFGIRTDMNSFTSTGNNPLQTLSPRFSWSYHLSQKFDLTGSVGRYFKIPSYTILGYVGNDGAEVNKNAKYIASNHFVLGTQYLPNPSLRLTFETFYKRYQYYPVSLTTGISLANSGADFGSVGSEAVSSTGIGDCYGFELFAQQKLNNRLFYVVSYTYARSKFSGSDKKLIASSWDYQHLFSATMGYKFKKEWQLGLKFRYAGGAPYTPFNLSMSQQNYLLTGTGTLDYNLTNTNRLAAFKQLDFRLDKKYNFKKTTLDLFIDIQNALLFKQQSNPDYTFKRNIDNTGFETSDGQAIKADGSNAIPVILTNYSTSVTPTIGFIFEF